MARKKLRQGSKTNMQIRSENLNLHLQLHFYIFVFEIYRLHVSGSIIKREYLNFADSFRRMRKLIKKLIANSTRGIEINSLCTLLKTTSIAVESLTPSSGRVHVIFNQPCNLITLLNLMQFNYIN